MASRVYEKVSDRVSSIDVSSVRDTVKDSIQNASEKISSYWQDLQVPFNNASLYL